MKTTKRIAAAVVLAVFGALVFGVPIAAFAADAGSCYAIADSDARSFCLARAHQDPGRCYIIADSGLRSQCLAEVRK